ncbi:amino acid transporter AVT1I-like [Prosopis cineraria]|uniref:amino acid transporter AVT1I-like n=1 Tax=Prosopis cineraria TaxID=364024 RepID=UPI00240FAE3C|nr:amino acid transporter AVT1I-like [Prosopis cineraria]XP_054801104.1 amino acid transporter AVT1I-like [Prosopis cineraria]
MEAKQRDGVGLSSPLLNGEAPPNKDASDGEASLGSTSFLKTCLNCLNALSGVGILSIPYALASGGWLSLILLFIIALATFYTGVLIKRCMDMNPGVKTYPDIGHCAFGRKGKFAVSITMYTELYLVATGFLILEGDNLNNIFPNIVIELAGVSVGGKQFFVLLIGLVILPSVWLNNLNLLSYISASGVVASVIIICSIFWTATVDGVGFHNSGTLIDWDGFPTSVSLYAFCYCAHPVFPTLYNSIRKKPQFSNALLMCFVLSTFGYASIAIFGYLMFGSEVQSQITLDLPINKFSSKVAIFTTLVNPISKYALMVIPITNALKGLLPRTSKSRLTSALISTALVISTVIVALAIPFFGYLMSLVGAILSVTASILLPCLCYLKISGTYNKFCVETVVIVGTILTGVVIGIFGTYTSVLNIIKHW